jgi:hypothetical protein
MFYLRGPKSNQTAETEKDKLVEMAQTSPTSLCRQSPATGAVVPQFAAKSNPPIAYDVLKNAAFYFRNIGSLT